MFSSSNLIEKMYVYGLIGIAVSHVKTISMALWDNFIALDAVQIINHADGIKI